MAPSLNQIPQKVYARNPWKEMFDTPVKHPTSGRIKNLITSPDLKVLCKIFPDSGSHLHDDQGQHNFLYHTCMI